MVVTYLVLPRTRPSGQGKVVIDLGPWEALLGLLRFQGSVAHALFLGSLASVGFWVGQVPVLLIIS